jgi:hypothetical protein
VVIIGDHCDYYKELLKIYRILDRDECFAIRNAYTRNICARITWAIINEGRSFFGQNPMASDFSLGSTFLFSTSYLEGITDSVRNTIAIQRATFPRKWASQAPPLALYGLSLPAGTPPTQWPAPAAAPRPAASGEKVGGQHQAWEDIRHQKIRSMMDPYLKKFNNFVSLSNILTSSGK